MATPTIIEALTQAAQDLRDAVAAVRNALTVIMAYFETKKTEIITIITEYRDRPPVVAIYCDPVNGSEANDGKTIAKPKKDLDAILRGMNNNSVEVRLMGDAVIRYRTNVYASLSIVGIQAANNAAGFTPAVRSIGFQAEATNSPDPGLGTFSGGLFLIGALLRTSSLNFQLLNVGPLDYRAHLISTGGNMGLFGPTITGTGSGNAPLIGTDRGRVTVFINPVLGANAAGKVFDGVAAGANPNTLWQYSTNLTAA